MVCNLRSDAVAFAASTTREPGAQPRPTTFPASSRDHRTGQQRHAPSVPIHCKASGIALPSRTAASLNATILISTAGRCSSLASTASATAVGASPASPLAVRIARVTQRHCSRKALRTKASAPDRASDATNRTGAVRRRTTSMLDLNHTCTPDPPPGGRPSSRNRGAIARSSSSDPAGPVTHRFL